STDNYVLLDIESGESIVSEALGENEYIQFSEYDPATGWLLIEIIDWSDNILTINVFDTKAQGAPILHRRIENYTSKQLGFGEESVWWVENQSLIQFSETDPSRWEDASDCEPHEDTTLFELPSGISIISYDPIQEQILAHNRNNSYFYQLSISRDANLNSLYVPFNSASYDYTIHS